MNNNSILKLYTNCIPVKGYTRSLISDLQYNEIHLIPNSLYEILTKNKGIIIIDEILKNQSQENKETLMEYFEFLLSKKLAFNVKGTTASFFPQIDLQYKHYSLLTNATIDIDKNSNLDAIKNIVLQLNSIGCEAILLRFYSDFSKELYNQIILYFLFTRVRSIEVAIENPNNTFKIDELIGTEKRIRKIILYNMEENMYEHIDDVRIEQRNSELKCHCEVKSPIYMNPNRAFFIEAQSFNSCLHGKIAIKRDGQIYNCPYSKVNYGPIGDNNLDKIVESQNFQKYWGVTKDKIEVCKVCEFRYNCVDCRILTDNNQNIYSRPKNCYYNPYIGKWQHEQGYYTLEECGSYSADNRYEPNVHFINNINQ